MSSRYEELKHLYDSKKYFKIVCGAGNEDPLEVYRLTIVYALAGANAIDVSANIEVVKSAVMGIIKAEEISQKINRGIDIKPFINVSVGLKGDPHVRKAEIISENCKRCGECFNVCHQNAVNPDLFIDYKKCIGCGNCYEVCIFKAINFYSKQVDFMEILPECIKSGAETLELHAIIPDDNAVLADWRIINSLVPNNFISMCLDRSYLSDNHLIDRILKVYEISKERTVIQADGAPMSGGEDDFNTTLQAVAIADIIRKKKLPVKIIASGGTNSLTCQLCSLCNVTVNGVAIGTFARKIIKDIISKDNFEYNFALIKEAVKIADKLIDDNMKFIQNC